MKFQNYLINEGIGSSLYNSIKNYTASKAIKFLKDKWLELEKVIKEMGKEDEFLKVINKRLKTNFKSLDQISKGKIQESVLNEDFKNFWQFLKDTTFPSLSFYPALSIWMELDTIFKGSSPDLKKIGVYGIFFIMIIATSHIKQWYNWKKQNSDEWEKEGKPGPFTFKK